LMASFGILLDRIIFRPLLGEPVFTSIMVTIGLSIVLRIATLVIFGYENYSFPAIFPETTITFLGIKISLAYLGIIFSVSLLILIFTMLFKFTKIGLAMRATAFNQIISLFMGINVKRIYAISWAVSSVIATVSGIMLASVHVLNPNLSFQALKAFPAIVIGGLESIPGAIVGGLIIGVIENLSSAYLGDVFGIGITDFMVFSTLFVVLFIRPYGFFGVREIERI
jgi:branched-chain amino acid transport system permease protein